MKKQLHSIMLAGLTLLAVQTVSAREGEKKDRGCGSMEYKAMEEKANPALKSIREQLEIEMQHYMKNNPAMSTQALITMPIVFHVVYNGAAENVSDNCIAQTLIALNKDFRKQNADFATKCPAVFQPMAADCEMQFCMATKDPTGAASNGITRTSTTVASFSTNNAVKYTAQGGKDVWDRNKFVNLWVCDLGSSLLGYGQFPGGSAATDGVVCHYKYLVQSGGCGAAPFELGRTTVHELGHFFNLRHIWGDANCGDDQVADTPTQQGSNFGCPTFPKVTCSNGPNGDMHVNYMDYVDDKCMVMFTAGQKTRMVAALNTSTRSGLLTSAATNCGATSIGISENYLSDLVSVFPNPSSGVFTINASIPNVSTADIIIYNAIGEAVLEKRITIKYGNGVEVDLTDKPEGMYLIKLKTSEGVVTKQIVISK